MTVEEREQCVSGALGRPEMHIADPDGPTPHVVHSRTVWIVQRVRRQLRRSYLTMPAAYQRRDVRPGSATDLGFCGRLHARITAAMPTSTKPDIIKTSGNDTDMA